MDYFQENWNRLAVYCIKAKEMGHRWVAFQQIRFPLSHKYSELSDLNYIKFNHRAIEIILSCGNIKAVQGNSGHSQAEMVTALYGHVLDKSQRESAA